MERYNIDVIEGADTAEAGGMGEENREEDEEEDEYN